MEKQFDLDDNGRRTSRDDSVFNLVPIEAAYFFSGMDADFSIYVKTGKTVSLLCQNIKITDSTLEKIDAAEDAGNLVCVNKKSYRYIIINAAKNAENNGIPIDWDSVYEMADNPPNSEIFIEEKENSEIIDHILIRENPQKKYAEKFSEYEKEKKSSIKIPTTQETVRTLIDDIEKEETEENTSSGPKAIKNLGFKDGPKPLLSENITTDEIIKTLSCSENLEIENKLPPEHFKQIEKYHRLSSKVRNIFNESARYYKFNNSTVEFVAQEISHMVRTSHDLLMLQCMQFLRENEEYLVSHSQNVACINSMISRWIGLPRDESITLAKIGIIHDIGEQLIPEKILFGPSKINSEAYDVIKKHPIHSYRIAIASGISNPSILKAIKNHHEKINGSGYPDALKANNIPIYARITAVADAMDAMLTKKPYRKDQTILDVLQEFSTIRDSDLDSKIVNIITDNMIKLFIGKKVRLTNGKTGIIVSINSSGYDAPLILVDGKYVKTNKYNKVVEIDLYAGN